MSAVLTATIVRRERSSAAFLRSATYQGGVSYEWVATLFRDGEFNGRKVTRTRTELREFCAELGYVVTSEGRES